jgi:hypothetical protein
MPWYTIWNMVLHFPYHIFQRRPKNGDARIMVLAHELTHGQYLSIIYTILLSLQKYNLKKQGTLVASILV